MAPIERLEIGIVLERLVSQKGIDPGRLRLSLHRDQVELQGGEVLGLGPRVLADHDVDAIGLRLALEAGSEVHIVAHDRIVEALVRAQVADRADARIEPGAHANGGKIPAFALGVGAPDLIEAAELVAHGERRAAGVLGVFGIVQGRVPERHDAVAHIFVDGAFAFEDDVGHRCQEPVDESGELLRVKFFGNRGEVPDIAKQHRHGLHLAAQGELFRMGGELLDHRRRQIAAERAAHLAALGLGAQIDNQGSGQIDKHGGDRGIDRIEEPLQTSVGVPGGTDGGRDGGAAEHGAPQRAQTGQQEDQAKPEREQIDDFSPGRPVRAIEIALGEDLLDDLGMHLDSRHHRVQGRGAQVHETGGAGADQHDPLGHEPGVEIGLEDPPGGDEALRLVSGVIDPDRALAVGRRDIAADLDVIEAGMLAETGLAAGAGRLDDIGPGALGDAQCLGGERRIEGVTQAEHQRHATDHAVEIRHVVEAAVAGGRRLDFGQIDHRAGIVAYERRGIVPGNGKAALHGRGARERPLGEHESRDHIGPGDGLGKDSVVVRQRVRSGAQGVEFRRRRPHRQHPPGRGAIGLGENHVEGDHRCPQLVEPVDQPRHQIARPRPLAEPLQRLVVQIDDAHRHRRVIGPRAQTHEGIEDHQPGLFDDRRLARPDSGKTHQDSERNENMQPASNHGML